MKNEKTLGRWSKEEHLKFMEAIKIYGKNWKKVEEFVKTRSGTQIRSHAQKFFNRIEKEINKNEEKRSRKLSFQSFTNSDFEKKITNSLLEIEEINENTSNTTTSYFNTIFVLIFQNLKALVQLESKTKKLDKIEEKNEKKLISFQPYREINSLRKISVDDDVLKKKAKTNENDYF